MPTAVIIGGTGLVGRHTISRLLGAGYAVYSVSRSGTRVSSETAVQADISTPEWVSALEVIDGPADVLVYSTFSTSQDIAYDNRINVGALMDSVNALQPKRIVYLSSVGAFGSNLVSADYTELSPKVGDSAYARDKIEAENYLQTLSSSTMITVLYPTNIYDGSSSRVGYYRDLLRTGYFIHKSGGHGTYNLVHADDVAAAVMAGLEARQIQGYADYVVNSEHLEFREWVEIVERHFDIDGIPKLPRGLEKIIRGPLRRIVARLGVRVPMRIPEPKATTYEMKVRYTSEKITRELGWHPIHRARDTLPPSDDR